MMLTGRWDAATSTLAAAALAMAVALLGITDYEGAGRIVIQLPWLGGATAATGAATAARPAAPTQAMARPALARPSKDPSARECDPIRERLGNALRRYRAETRRPMRSLDIFALLSAKVIDELPACPSGGSYRLDPARDDTVACTLH